MSNIVSSLQTLVGFALLACVVAFLCAPVLTHFLYKYNITRRNEYDSTPTRNEKAGTPIMGGLLVVVTVALVTFISNWSRAFTWVPVGVMLLSAFLGGVDDLLNIFGAPRRSRKVFHILNLIKIHKNLRTRIFLTLTLPWAIFKRVGTWMGSHPGRGMHVHEKLIFQFMAGGIAAWWIYFKLGEHWQQIYVPFVGATGDGFINIGVLIIPVFILTVMFTANAVKTGALITYTYFNVKPARFQMGDVGSLGLGALLGINAIVTNQILTLPLLAFVFVIEALSVIAQLMSKYFFGRRLFRMAPLHHHFELLGWSEEKIVMRFWMLHMAAVLAGLWIV